MLTKEDIICINDIVYRAGDAIMDIYDSPFEVVGVTNGLENVLAGPVVGVASLFPDAIHGWYGAPQSAACHQFIDRGPDKIGFFFEAAPTHPMLTATAASEFGNEQYNFMKELYRASFLIALQIDGVIDGDEGGRVTVASNGRMRFSYPINAALQESFQASMKSAAQMGPLEWGAD